MIRKLASIRTIGSVSPIEGADNIELVTVDGWQCVAKKGEFIAGQFCVYFEIDSFLPIREEFEFLRKSSCRKMGDKEGFRLRTIKLRGQISQGLVMPIQSFKELPFEGYHLSTGDAYGYGNGYDVTDILGVIKYDPPVPAQLAGICKGNFPSFIRKTDQERVQNLWKKVKDSDETFEVTIKLDGSSGTYYLNDGVFGVCSRNMELKEDENNTLWRLAKHYKIEEMLRAYGRNIALQGEVVGEGIQGNPGRIKGQEFWLFDIWHISTTSDFEYLDSQPQRYYLPLDRHHLHETYFSSLKHVPVINQYRKVLEFLDINDILSFADTPCGMHNFPGEHEGVVFKSNESNLTFKVISNKYLLKEKE